MKPTATRRPRRSSRLLLGPILGPTCTLLYRRLGTLAAAGADSPVDLSEMSACLGLGASTGRNAIIVRSLARLEVFDVAHWNAATTPCGSPCRRCPSGCCDACHPAHERCTGVSAKVADVSFRPGARGRGSPRSRQNRAQARPTTGRPGRQPVGGEGRKGPLFPPGRHHRRPPRRRTPRAPMPPAVGRRPRSDLFA